MEVGRWVGQKVTSSGEGGGSGVHAAKRARLHLTERIGGQGESTSGAGRAPGSMLLALSTTRTRTVPYLAFVGAVLAWGPDPGSHAPRLRLSTELYAHRAQRNEK